MHALRQFLHGQLKEHGAITRIHIHLRQHRNGDELLPVQSQLTPELANRLHQDQVLALIQRIEQRRDLLIGSFWFHALYCPIR